MREPKMREPYEYPEDRRPDQHDGEMVTVTDPALPDLAEPNFATTDVDPTPGSPRPVTGTEPNYATTDVDPTPGSPRPVTGTEPNYATTDVDPTPGSPRPVTGTEPNYATTDVDPTLDVPGVSGSAAAHPVVDTEWPDTSATRDQLNR
jgi:hypothetical protein